VLSLWSAMQGHGPFAANGPGDSVLALQLFLAVVSVPVILLAAIVEELHRTEAEYRGLYNRAPAPQHTLDTEGKIIGVSDYWLELMGYAREEVLGHSITKFLAPSSAERCRCDWPRFLGRGEGGGEEFEFVKRSGEIVEALVSRRVERDPAGHAVRTLGVLTDMTARRKAERERDRLFEIAQDFIAIARFDGTFHDINPALEAALGYGRAELRGTPYIDMVHPDDRAETLADVERLKTGAPLVGLEIRYRHRDGSWRWSSWRTTVVHEEGLLYSVGRDTTERRQTEEALRQAQKMEAVGHLTGGVAHDFNNLLTVIVGNLELLRPQVADQPRLRRLVKAMRHAAERGARLTGQLLAFSRRQTLRPETLDVNALVRGFEPLIRRAIGESTHVELRLARELQACTIDAGQLEAALLNLAMNARDAMPGGGRLVIETKNLERAPWQSAQNANANPAAFVLVTVRDTGVGMPPELVERVFEPFFTTKEVGKGSGLGLSQVYGFIRQSGGQVEIDSEVGKGTEIRLYLPATEAVITLPARSHRVRGKPGRGSERILLVEDDAEVLRTAAAMMSDLGYKVLTAETPVQALEILRRSEAPIDLLFSDVMMPQMSGVQLAEEARTLRPGLRVLLSSGHSRESLTHRTPLDEGLPLLAKPYKQANLAAQLRAAFDAH
jgi:PAS domain S-box-containing protein